MFPKLTLLRVAVSAGTATVGYVSFKVQEGKEWLNKKMETINDLMNSFQSIPLKKSSGYLIENDNNNDKNNIDLTITPIKGNEQPVYLEKIEHKDFSGFVRKMIEIDSLLQSGDWDNRIALPRIVVIGSQSSGKSSVLESLVGHSFLPKGNNMITRRPLLLTLINEPGCQADYAVFPLSTGNIRIDDFGKVAERVKEMNMAVPDGEWVTEEPISLHIHSKNLPDLTLIDLPGYIAVTNRRQPAVLRERIQFLCDKYLMEPNIILAVSAADVDLANSEALQAARRHDRHGERTIGVVTKLDLIEPKLGAELLLNEDYPLKQGYVGVVCGAKRTDHENFPVIHYQGTQHGIDALRRKLVSTLEFSLRNSIHSVLTRVNEELGEIRYELKVRYSDRNMTAEGYLADVVGRVREGVDNLANSFSKTAVRHLLQKELFDKQLISILEQISNDDVKKSDLDTLVVQLTRAGWGRQCAHIVANRILEEIKAEILETEPLRHHPSAAESLLQSIDQACRSRILAAADQIENALKPYKQPNSLEYTPAEWSEARDNLLKLLVKEEEQLSSQVAAITQTVFKSTDRMRRNVERVMAGHMIPETEQAAINQIVLLWQKQKSLRQIHGRIPRQSIWASGFFRSPDNKHIDDCPATYLFLLSRRLLSISALYAQDELAPDQRLRLPDLLLDKHRADPMQFARENGYIFRHIELLQRQSLLETVRDRLIRTMMH